MTTYSNFRVNECQEIKDDKSNYPNYLNINLDKRTKHQALVQIATALNSGNDETLIMLAGKLEVDEDESE